MHILSLKKIGVIPFKTGLVAEGEDIVKLILSVIKKGRYKLRDGDVIAIADKILASSQGRMIDYSRIKLSTEATFFSEKYGLEPGFVQVVLNESEKIYGGVPRAILSLHDGIIIANAGVDHKNAPEGKAAVWPKNPDIIANKIRMEIEEIVNKKIGIIIVDSRVDPMRKGTVGIAIGSSGIMPVIDCRGKDDLYGKKLKITFINVIDDLASMAHLAMGETTEKVPIVLIRNSPVIMSSSATSEEAKISEEECLFMRSLKEYFCSDYAEKTEK